MAPERRIGGWVGCFDIGYLLMALTLPASFDILLVDQCSWSSFEMVAGCRLRADLHDGMIADEMVDWLNNCCS